MANKVPNKKNDAATHIENVMEGLRTHFLKKTVLLNGASWKVDALIKRLDGQVALLHASDAAHTSWRQAVLAQRNDAADARRLLRAVEAMVTAAFGSDSHAYADFGYTPPKIAKRSAETTLAAVVKMKATRQARHTMGRKQRQSIRGTPASEPPVIGVINGVVHGVAPTTAPTVTTPAANGTASSPNGTTNGVSTH
jgi:hypothetical protein